MKLINVFPVTVITLLILLSTVAAAGNIGISAEVSQASIPFEGRDTLTVRLVWEGEPFLYQIDDFPMPKLEKLKILGSSSSVSSAVDSTLFAGEKTTRTYRYVLEPTDFGTGVIRPLNLTAKNRLTEEEQPLQTGRLTVEIAKPVPKVEESAGVSAFIILIFGAVLILIGAGIVILKKKRAAGRSDTDQQPGEKQYLDALAELKKESVSDGKLFYSRLYRLLLQYLEKERSLEVSGKTGEEVLRIVNEMDADEDRGPLHRLLDEALKIKFRPDEPSPSDIADTYNAVRDFFERKMKI